MSAEGTAGAKPNNDGLVNVLDLRMAGVTAEIGAVTDNVTEALSRLSVPEEKTMEIALAVQEALANAVVHGCGNDPSKQVQCRVYQHRNGGILIVVADPGTGFPPELVPDPNRSDRLYEGHGRGVYLIHELMDEVRYVGSGNEIQMWKY